MIGRGIFKVNDIEVKATPPTTQASLGLDVSD
jgi:hypothetical protein